MGVSVRDGRIICVHREGLDDDPMEESNCGPGNRDEDAVEESNCGPGNRDRDEDLNEKKESECDRLKARLKSAESEGDKKAVLKIGLEMADSNCPGSELPVEEGKIPDGLKKYMDDKKKGKKSKDKESDEKDDKKDFDGKPFGDDDGDDKPNVLDKEPKNAKVQENKNESLREHFTRKKNDMLFERLVEKWTK